MYGSLFYINVCKVHSGGRYLFDNLPVYLLD